MFFSAPVASHQATTGLHRVLAKVAEDILTKIRKRLKSLEFRCVQMFIEFLKSILERILIGKLVYFSRLTIGFLVELS